MIKMLGLEDTARQNQIVCSNLNDSGFRAKSALSANTACDEMYNNFCEQKCFHLGSSNTRSMNPEISLRAADVYISTLRDKFFAFNSLEIRTVQGLGYKVVL